MIILAIMIHLGGWYVRVLAQPFNIVEEKLCTVRQLILICPLRMFLISPKRCKNKRGMTNIDPPEKSCLDSWVSPKSWDHLKSWELFGWFSRVLVIMDSSVSPKPWGGWRILGVRMAEIDVFQRKATSKDQRRCRCWSIEAALPISDRDIKFVYFSLLCLSSQLRQVSLSFTFSPPLTPPPPPPPIPCSSSFCCCICSFPPPTFPSAAGQGEPQIVWWWDSLADNRKARQPQILPFLRF